MSEYNIQMNKYNALSDDYDQLYPKPMKHASTHAKDGSDPILPSSIGAYSKEESNTLLANKAPAGYGLGTNAKFLTSADDANDIWQSGWYRYGSGNIPQNGITLSYLHVMRVDGCSSGVFVQTVYGLTDNESYQICSVARRFKYGAKITPFEYENPPMILGYEYRTTERYLCKPVYKKLLLFTGAMTDGYSDMAHNIANIANVVGCYAELFVGSTTVSTPVLDGNNTIIFSATQNTIRKTAVGNYSAYSARVLMSYTKTTD